MKDVQEIYKHFNLPIPTSYDDYFAGIVNALKYIGKSMIYMSKSDSKLKFDKVAGFVEQMKKMGIDIDLEVLSDDIYHSRWGQINPEDFRKRYKEFRRKVMLWSMLDQIRTAAWEDHPWFDRKGV